MIGGRKQRDLGKPERARCLPVETTNRVVSIGATQKVVSKTEYFAQFVVIWGTWASA